MKIKKYTDSLFRLSVNLTMLLIFWGGMLRKSFNADTISHMASMDADIGWNIADGRYVIALGDAILFKLGIKVTTNLSITMMCALLLFALAMLVVQKIYMKWQPEDKWANFGYFCGLNLVFLNVLFSELLMFSECSVYFAFGYLMAALGVLCFSRRKYFGMLACLLIASCTYQYTVIFAAILIAFYVCLKNKGELNFGVVKEEIAGIFPCIGAGAVNLISVKVLEKMGVIEKFNKQAGWGGIDRKFSDFGASLISLLESSLEILPNLWIPFLFLMFLFLLMAYSCIKSGKIKKLFFVFLLFLGSMAMLYGIPFMQENFFFPPRMAFCFYLLQGLLVVTAYTICNGKLHQLLSLGCAGYLMVQLLFSDYVVTNHFVSNTLDEVYVNMMYQEVLNYEAETGITVTKIVVYKDANAPDNYSEVSYHEHQINERTLGTATNSLIGQITGRCFEKVEGKEEVYDQYFKGKNWNYLNLTEQLVFVDDTVYWCIF